MVSVAKRNAEATRAWPSDGQSSAANRTTESTRPGTLTTGPFTIRALPSSALDADTSGLGPARIYTGPI
eukprot:5002550-Lingulodinium_polyedra.AAC.1